jgi:hypothetical protein
VYFIFHFVFSHRVFQRICGSLYCILCISTFYSYSITTLPFVFSHRVFLYYIYFVLSTIYFYLLFSVFQPLILCTSYFVLPIAYIFLCTLFLISCFQTLFPHRILFFPTLNIFLHCILYFRTWACFVQYVFPSLSLRIYEKQSQVPENKNCKNIQRGNWICALSEFWCGLLCRLYVEHVPCIENAKSSILFSKYLSANKG